MHTVNLVWTPRPALSDSQQGFVCFIENNILSFKVGEDFNGPKDAVPFLTVDCARSLNS